MGQCWSGAPSCSPRANQAESGLKASWRLGRQLQSKGRGRCDMTASRFFKLLVPRLAPEAPASAQRPATGCIDCWPSSPRIHTLQRPALRQLQSAALWQLEDGLQASRHVSCRFGACHIKLAQKQPVQVLGGVGRAIEHRLNELRADSQLWGSREKYRGAVMVRLTSDGDRVGCCCSPSGSHPSRTPNTAAPALTRSIRNA